MTKVVLKNVHKSFGKVDVLHHINLEIESNHFTVFVGPSGCGKSTLLRLIAGLEDVTDGSIHIADLDVTYMEPAKRGVAMVFQSYALYPHMTVYENMSFALRRSKYPKAEIHSRVVAAAETLKVTHLLDRKPKQLSGGQRQRVAIGRAIIRDPKVFLFDEPLSNLDATLRVQMRMHIATLKEKLHTTMIYVTHDQVEAMTLADKIVVMNAGRIEQIGSPLQLYHHPINKFVAGFIGSPKMNFLNVAIEALKDDVVTLRLPHDQTMQLPVALPVQIRDLGPGSTAELGIRPEHLFLTSSKDALFEGHIHMIEHLGGEIYLYVEIDKGQTLLVRTSGDQKLKVGEKVHVDVKPKDCHLFHADTGLSFERPSQDS
ncbi:MAG: sn-glycerol-3-phosphate ABC transporter ATP-binding protein UgpC [Alphaproteobacteria bacterium]